MEQVPSYAPFLSGNRAVGVNKVNLRVVSRGDRRLQAAVIHTAVSEENQREGDLRVSYRVRSRLRQVTSGRGCTGRPGSPPAPRLRGSPAQREGLAEAGQGTRCGARCLAGLTQGLSDGCAESQTGSATPGRGRFGESERKHAQRTVRPQIWVIVMAGVASQEVSGFAELIGKRRYF